MAAHKWGLIMPVESLPIITQFGEQRFKQFSPENCANFYQVSSDTGKRPVAMYPVIGRKHVRVLNTNRLVFAAEPRAIFKSIDFTYVVVGSVVHQVDNNFNTKVLPNPDFNRSTGELFTDFLVVADKVYVMIADNVAKKLFVINETAGTMVTITDTNAPKNPKFVATFGSRFVVSNGDSGQWFLSRINLDGDSFTPSTAFTVAGVALFNFASGKVQQLAVLHNQMYIFTDFGCDIWMNMPSVFREDETAQISFPFKLNTSYNFDYGMADPLSLDVDFGRMTWLGKNRNGLVAFMASDGGAPQIISTQAVNTLIQKTVQEGNGLSPFLSKKTNGFMYQYENTVFYRVSAGNFLDFGELDITNSANSLEYNFNTGNWHRCIEVNGERSRIQKHVFFNNKHLVTVSGEGTVYEAAGDIYINELRNEAQENPQADDAFIPFPMRYEVVTPIYSQADYSEFITDYVEIDFVFGDSSRRSDAPFDNTVYIVDEDSTEEKPVYLVTESGEFIIEEGTNTPVIGSDHYNALFKPHIELFWSDDGGVTFHSADVREFSQLGIYRWRMRWYTLGPSRNRCYKLICVSPTPIVVLGAVMSVRRSSGGAN